MSTEPTNPAATNRKLLICAGYAVVFAFTFFLLFDHLDNHLLWGDEAETAVLANNVVKFGVPRTFDGTNYILLHGTRDENRDHLWTWSPWMQEYLTAGSFMAFGADTWAARAPFALVGWASLGLLALVTYRIYRDHRVAMAAVILMGTAEVFLLHARQCRYYSISVFTQVLFIAGIYQLLRQDRRGAWTAALALVLQFYSNYIVLVGNVPALAFLAWTLRKQGWRAIGRVALIPAILAAAALPWIIFAQQWGQSQAVSQELNLSKVWGYLLEFHFHFLPLCFLLLPLLGRWRRDAGQPAPEAVVHWERFALFLLASYLAVILLAPGFYLRYLLPLFPVAVLLAAAWIFRYVRWPSVAILLVVLQVGTNVIPLATAYPVRGRHHLRLPLADFIRGISHPYADRFSDVLAFFRQEGRPGEIVLGFDPEFPLRFYTSLSVFDGNVMEPPKGHVPRWILPVSASGLMTLEPVPLPDYLKRYYDPIVLSVHNSPLGDSVPEPDVYQYQTATNQCPFVIYKLKDGAL